MLDFTGVKAITIPEGEVKKITCNGVVLWKAGYTNLVPLSTEEDGKTIYNGGLGYKDGYRVRSGGAEASFDGASCTGYTPVKASDIVRMSGCNALTMDNSNSITVYDKDHAVLGQTCAGSPNYGYGFFQSTYFEYNWAKSKGVKEETTGVYIFTMPPDANIAYMRVTANTGNNGSGLIVTVNEEII